MVLGDRSFYSLVSSPGNQDLVGNLITSVFCQNYIKKLYRQLGQFHLMLFAVLIPAQDENIFQDLRKQNLSLRP